MYAICLESSHKRGMGHLFRGIHLFRYIVNRKGNLAIILINQDPIAVSVLENEQIPYEKVCFHDTYSDWESRLIKKYDIDVWINDKYQTARALYQNVKKNRGVLLAAIDEESGNDDLLDVHFVGMVFQKDFYPKGKYVFQGMEYIVLNEEISRYRYVRNEAKRIIVSLGGSDTYGVTVKVLEILKEKNIQADIVVGPSFEHMDELMQSMTEGYHVFQNVSSLIQKFSEYDLAITGGGVTCFEAAASGLPCIIVANEILEIDTALYMEELGTSVFAGYYAQIEENKFDILKLNIEKMSKIGLQKISLNGVRNIFFRLQECTEKMRKVNE